MGYYTSFDGEITIDPPLTWAEIENSPYLPENAHHTMIPDVKFHVVEEVVEDGEGHRVRRYADAIVPITEEAFKGYGIASTVESIIDEYGSAHTFAGRFDCEGEEAGDLWRLVVRGNRVAKVKPRIVWPDEDGGE